MGWLLLFSIVPALTIKNITSSLVSLPIGKLGPNATRVFAVSEIKLLEMRPILTSLSKAGKVEFWTDVKLADASHFDESMKSKVEEMDSLHLRSNALASTQAQLNDEIEKLKAKSAHIDHVHSKAENIDALIEKTARVESMLSKSAYIDSVYAKATYLETLLARITEADELLTKAAEVDVLHTRLLTKISQAEENLVASESLRLQLTERVATPLAEICRQDSSRLISCSQKTALLIEDMSTDLPAGTWLVIFEGAMSSPNMSAGTVGIVSPASLGERPTGALAASGQPPFVMTEVVVLAAPSTVQVSWRASTGAIRMQERRLTALKVMS